MKIMQNDPDIILVMVTNYNSSLFSADVVTDEAISARELLRSIMMRAMSPSK